MTHPLPLRRITQLLACSEGSRVKQVSTPLTGRNRFSPVWRQAPQHREAPQGSDSACSDLQTLRRPAATPRPGLLRRLPTSLPAGAVRAGVPPLGTCCDRRQEGQRRRPNTRRDRGSPTRRDEHRPQTASPRVGRTARQARRPLRFPARHSPADPRRPAQPVTKSDRTFPPVRVAHPAWPADAPSAALGSISQRCDAHEGTRARLVDDSGLSSRRRSAAS